MGLPQGVSNAVPRRIRINLFTPHTCQWPSPHSWTDNDGDPFTAVPESAIITNILIYWTTQTIATSFGLYRESLGRVPGRKLAIGSGYCAVPSAMAIFPRDLFVMPRAVGRLAFNLAQWTEFPSGGHFAALERPEVRLCARRRDEVQQQRPRCTDGRLRASCLKSGEHPMLLLDHTLHPIQELEADVRRFFFVTRPFASLVEEAGKGYRRTSPPMDAVDQFMAVLGLALLLKVVLSLLAYAQ